MTWIVVLGSSIIMFLWIVIYSFFPSSDFMREVVVLCGQGIFWFSVVISIIIALGELQVSSHCRIILISL